MHDSWWAWISFARRDGNYVFLVWTFLPAVCMQLWPIGLLLDAVEDLHCDTNWAQSECAGGVPNSSLIYYFQTLSCTQRRKRKSFSSTGILNITLAAESSQHVLQNMPACPVSSSGLNLLEVLPMFADPIVTGKNLLVFCRFLIPCKQ